MFILLTLTDLGDNVNYLFSMINSIQAPSLNLKNFFGANFFREKIVELGFEPSSSLKTCLFDNVAADKLVHRKAVPFLNKFDQTVLTVKRHKNVENRDGKRV